MLTNVGLNLRRPCSGRMRSYAAYPRLDTRKRAWSDRGPDPPQGPRIAPKTSGGRDANRCAKSGLNIWWKPGPVGMARRDFSRNDNTGPPWPWSSEILSAETSAPTLPDGSTRAVESCCWPLGTGGLLLRRRAIAFICAVFALTRSMACGSSALLPIPAAMPLGATTVGDIEHPAADRCDAPRQGPSLTAGHLALFVRCASCPRHHGDGAYPSHARKNMRRRRAEHASPPSSPQELTTTPKFTPKAADANPQTSVT